jgi:hypothetical protein
MVYMCTHRKVERRPEKGERNKTEGREREAAGRQAEGGGGIETRPRRF